MKVHVSTLQREIQLQFVRSTEQLVSELTSRTTDIALERLGQFGNRPSVRHQAAMAALAHRLASMAFGLRPGRIAFPLPTGMGKTQAVVAFVAAICELGLIGQLSVTIAAQRAEALSDIVRDLIAHGVPSHLIGLKHKVKPSGTPDSGVLPATGDYDNRPFLLVTHQGVMTASGPDVDLLQTFQGRPRNLTIWDESLIGSQAFSVSLLDAEAELADLRVRAGNDEALTPVAEMLRRAVDTLLREREAQEKGRAPAVIELGHLCEEDREDAHGLLRRARRHYPSLKGLIDLFGHSVRVVAARSGVAVRCVQRVPPELSNVAILDASAPIRLLQRHDPTITVDEPSFGGIKRYDNVELKVLKHPTGRASTKKAMPEIADEVAYAISIIDPREGVLIFTFKDADGVDCVDAMKAALRQRGVDLNAMVSDTKGRPAPRIVFRTWGQETSDSQFAYCRHVFLPCVLRRSEQDIAGALIGQSGCLTSDLSEQTIEDCVKTEMAHVVYQALSRGSSRYVDDDQARPMIGYLITKEARLADYLASTVMPGLQVTRWEGQKLGQLNRTETVAKAIESYLASIPPEVSKISITKLRRVVDEARGLSTRCFQEARDRALAGSGWSLKGRTLVRDGTQITLVSCKESIQASSDKRDESLEHCLLRRDEGVSMAHEREAVECA